MPIPLNPSAASSPSSSSVAAQSLLDQGFVVACRTSDVPAMMPKRVVVEGRGLLVCRHRMRFLVVDELCPHRQKSMALGLVMGAELICPHHQYRFEIATGACVSHPCAPLATYEVASEGDTIYVRLPAPTAAPNTESMP